jgi:hypothetical protein
MELIDFKTFLKEDAKSKAARLVKNINNPEVTIEHPSVKSFIDKSERRLISDPRDNNIDTIKSLDELNARLAKYSDALSHKDKAEVVKKEVSAFTTSPMKDKAKLIFENDQIMIVQPLTYAACRYYGRPNSWCISTTKAFYNDYSEEDAFNFIISKDNPERRIAVLVNADNKISSIWDRFNNGKNLHWLSAALQNYGTSVSKIKWASKSQTTKELEKDIRGHLDDPRLKLTQDPSDGLYILQLHGMIESQDVLSEYFPGRKKIKEIKEFEITSYITPKKSLKNIIDLFPKLQKFSGVLYLGNFLDIDLRGLRGIDLSEVTEFSLSSFKKLESLRGLNVKSFTNKLNTITIVNVNKLKSIEEFAVVPQNNYHRIEIGECRKINTANFLNGKKVKMLSVDDRIWNNSDLSDTVS